MAAFAVVVAALLVEVPVVEAHASRDTGRAWEPPPLRDALYAASPGLCNKPFGPVDDLTGLCTQPEHRQSFPADRTLAVQAADGETIHVEVWLPRAQPGGPQPPDRLPVVADISPYHTSEELRPAFRYRELLVPRGYAYAQVHMRGTGSSTGCFEVHSRTDADDAARVVEQLATAPWSSGRVGLVGRSHDASAALNAAGRGDPDRLRGLRAVVAGSPMISPYDMRSRDGVLIAGASPDYWLQVNNKDANTLRPQAGRLPDLPERAPCRIEEGRASADAGSAPNPWEVERELRAIAGDIDVPTLVTMGLQEIQGRQLDGFFDQIGVRTRGRIRKAALIGQWGHSYPDVNHRVPGWARLDWDATLVGWLDRWVLGEENGVEEWPVVQVQDTTGQWRAEPGYPLTGGDAGQLVLGRAGLLGAGAGGNPAPEGADDLPARAVLSPRVQRTPGPETGLRWRTPALTVPLRVTGVPVLDLWVTLERPAGQLVAELIVSDADGNPVPLTRRLGARSLRHLGPVVDGRLAQTEPEPPAVGTPLRVQIRFDPTDLVVPVGGRLEVALGTAGPAESGEVFRPVSQGVYTDVLMTGVDPEGGAVRVLHDCAHLSALRFLMPSSSPDLLDVREVHQRDAPLGSGVPADAGMRTGGLAADVVCDQPPLRLASFG